MISLKTIRRSLLETPLVRPVARSAYIMGYHALERSHLTRANLVPEVCVSPVGNHAFFGYYDKSPWDDSGRHLLFLGVDFADRMPDSDDIARVCLVEPARRESLRVIAETRAWCWQQGAMLQWVGNTERLVFNDCDGGSCVARIDGVDGSRIRTLPRPVYALSKDGTQALSLDFGRIHFARPGYGYKVQPATHHANPSPTDDGVWWMSMETGESKLIVSLERLANRYQQNTPGDAFHYVLHAEFNPSGKRCVFLHRYFRQNGAPTTGPHHTRMYTVGADGSGLHLLEDSGFVSHFTWKDDEHVLATSRHEGLGFNYHLYTDQTEEVSIVGRGVLTLDGHPTYSPNGRWLLTDTYPDRVGKRWLILYDLLRSRRIDLGRYDSPKRYSGPLRCDLHPRWSRDGQSVCFDSVHEGIRGVYQTDVSRVLEEAS